MKFTIPKLNVQYRLLEDVKLELFRFDSINKKLLNIAHGVSYYNIVLVTLNAGTIIKFVKWEPNKHLKIRIIATGNKSFQSLCGYLANTDGMNFIENTEFEPVEL